MMDKDVCKTDELFKDCYDRFAERIANRFQRILDFPLYKENPINMSFDSILEGCVERKRGMVRYSNSSLFEDFYDDIFEFCRLVTIGESGINNDTYEEYISFVDSHSCFSKVKLYDRNLHKSDGKILPWMSTVNDKPITIQDSLWYKPGEILFLSYWKSVEKNICNWVNCYHFCSRLNINDLRNEILKTQLFVFCSIDTDPTFVVNGECGSWICCLPTCSYGLLEKVAKKVYNDSYKVIFRSLIEDCRKKLSNYYVY